MLDTLFVRREAPYSGQHCWANLRHTYSGNTTEMPSTSVVLTSLPDELQQGSMPPSALHCDLMATLRSALFPGNANSYCGEWIDAHRLRMVII